MGFKDWLKNREERASAGRAIETALNYKKISEYAAEETRKKLIEKGIGILTEEIEKQPSQHALYLHRANMFISIDEYEKAKTDLEKVPLDDEKILKEATKGGMNLRKTVREHLLLSEYHLGNYEKAVEHFIKMRMGEDVPEEVFKDTELNHYAKGEMFFEYASAYSANEKYGEAIKEYEKVLEMDPNFESETLKKFGTPSKDMFFFKLALAEVKMKNAEGVIRYCKRALDINPKNKNAQQIINKIAQGALEKLKEKNL